MTDVIDIQPTETGMIPATTTRDAALMSPQQLDAAVGQIERAAEAKKRLILAALKLTYRDDWVDFGGKPYLTGSGAERLCAVGIRLSTPLFDVKESGEDVLVECVIEASWSFTGQTVTALGACSTRDKFFYGGGSDRLTNFRKCVEAAEGNERLARQLLAQDVKKKAYKNAISRAVRAVMGIADLTWEQMKALGFTPENAGASVSYSKGATTKTRAKAKQAEPAKHVTISELAALAKGSVVSTSGAIVNVNKAGKRNAYVTSDGTKQTAIIVWSEDDPVAFAINGAAVHFPRVTVGEFRGEPQYVADSIEPVEPGATESDDNGDDAIPY